MAVAVFVCLASALLGIGYAQEVQYIGAYMDITNFDPKTGGKPVGQAGYWMADFAAPSAGTHRPTNSSERNALPAWAGPIYHVPPIWNFFWRTFSQDGPCLAAGGFASWANVTLPSGEHGGSGAIVDPAAAENDNNSINRISLRQGVPASFLFHVVVDNTGGHHYNAVNRIRARGEHNGHDFAPAKYPQPGAAGFNGVPDVYTFRFTNFTAGDCIKVQFNGQARSTGYGGASFAGFMFDTTP